MLIVLSALVGLVYSASLRMDMKSLPPSGEDHSQVRECLAFLDVALGKLNRQLDSRADKPRILSNDLLQQATSALIRAQEAVIKYPVSQKLSDQVKECSSRLSDIEAKQINIIRERLGKPGDTLLGPGTSKRRVPKTRRSAPASRAEEAGGDEWESLSDEDYSAFQVIGLSMDVQEAARSLADQKLALPDLRTTSFILLAELPKKCHELFRKRLNFEYRSVASLIVEIEKNNFDIVRYGKQAPKKYTQRESQIIDLAEKWGGFKQPLRNIFSSDKLASISAHIFMRQIIFQGCQVDRAQKVYKTKGPHEALAILDQSSQFFSEIMGLGEDVDGYVHLVRDNAGRLRNDILCNESSNDIDKLIELTMPLLDIGRISEALTNLRSCESLLSKLPAGHPRTVALSTAVELIKATAQNGWETARIAHLKLSMKVDELLKRADRKSLQALIQEAQNDPIDRIEGGRILVKLRPIKD